MTLLGTINTGGLEEALRKLPGKVETDRVVDQALKEGAKIVRTQAQANLRAHGSVDTGLLVNTMQIRRKPDELPGLVEVTLKPSSKLSMVVRQGKSRPTRARPSKYAHFVEFGTEHSLARPFMRPAVATKKGEAQRKIAEAVHEGVARAARKLGLK